MQKNALKAAMEAGQPCLNGWLSIGSPFVAEIMAAQGFDALTVDVQHGFLDYSHAMGMLQALRGTGVTPLARVPWNEPGIIMKMLDAGAYGIICPMVNNAEEAALFASYMRYPPRGTRSFGPTRALFAAGDGYAQEANEEMLAFAMIETADGVANVEEIAGTEGIDGLYIGPADLTLGVTNGRLAPGMDRQEDEMIEVIKRILAAAKSAGKFAVLHCGSAEYGAKAIGWGFDMVTISQDVKALAGHAGAAVQTARTLLKG